MTKPPLPVAEIFSQLVRDALVRAAQTRVVGPTDRIRAIEKATKYAQQQHPHLFRKD